MAKRNGSTVPGKIVEHTTIEAGEVGKSNVIPIKQRANQETVEALEEMLQMAKRGEVTGMIFAIQFPSKKYTIGSSGFYREDPLAALGVVGRLFSAIDDAVQASGDEI